MTYVIHGATGAQGGPVVSVLAAAGKPVVALTRDPNAVVPGARVVAADYSSATELTEAYRGAEGVFVHLPVVSEEERRAYARNIVAAVREARPGRVVLSTSGFAIDEAESAVSTLVGGLADSRVSHAVVAPELYLENLLAPHVLGPARERGVLRYPLRADFPVSWASHLDIADVAVALFERGDVTGVVSVGQYPAVTGAELAEAFGARLGRSVVYEPITAEEFRASLASLIGEGPAAGVAASYQAMDALPCRSIDPERSAQKLLGVTPRTTGQWLNDMNPH
jgi:uncharacterized protein YbjT (DUF2867 family)